MKFLLNKPRQIRILGFIWILIINIILMLILTMVVASLTLIERKVLSLIQRRVGPNFVGYRGRLQYIADALKLFLKGALIPDEANKFWFIAIPAFISAVCYTLWINTVWGPNLCLFEIEYNLVYVSLLSMLFSLCIILTGYFSRNKYAMLAAIRSCLLVLNLELFMGLMILNLLLIGESFSFFSYNPYQEIFWLIFLFFGLSGFIILTFLLEANRAPFDLAEAESELVAGYTTELGGFYFGLYYLGEYLHLFVFSLVLSVLFFGGWEFPNFLYFFYIKLYTSFDVFELIN